LSGLFEIFQANRFGWPQWILWGFYGCDKLAAER
jgi:hypothetical protein